MCVIFGSSFGLKKWVVQERKHPRKLQLIFSNRYVDDLLWLNWTQGLTIEVTQFTPFILCRAFLFTFSFFKYYEFLGSGVVNVHPLILFTFFFFFLVCFHFLQIILYFAAAKFILVEEIASINCIYLCIGNFCWVLIHVLAKLWTSVLDKNYTMNGYVDVKQTQLDQCWQWL